MLKAFLKDAVGWGLGLWFIGYALGMVLFFVVPPALIGWIIMPIGAALTVWVAFKKLSAQKPPEYLVIAVVWTLIAVLFDYIFIVKMLKPVDGYYKFDVYVYYALTFLIPFAAGLGKNEKEIN
jgi:hypothetical protein